MDFDLTKMFIHHDREDEIRFVRDIVISIDVDDLMRALEKSHLYEKPSFGKRISFIYHYVLCHQIWNIVEDEVQDIIELYKSEISELKMNVINKYFNDYPFQKKFSNYISEYLSAWIMSAYRDRLAGLGATKKNLHYLSEKFISLKGDLEIENVRVEEMALYCILKKRDELELTTNEKALLNKIFKKKDTDVDKADTQKSKYLNNEELKQLADKIITDRDNKYGAKWIFMNHKQLFYLEYDEQRQIVFAYAEKYKIDLEKYTEDEIDLFIEEVAENEDLRISRNASTYGWRSLVLPLKKKSMQITDKLALAGFISFCLSTVLMIIRSVIRFF